MLREEYLNLRVKTTLNGIPKEQVKKMIEDFHNKDYLAKAMGVDFGELDYFLPFFIFYWALQVMLSPRN